MIFYCCKLSPFLKANSILYYTLSKMQRFWLSWMILMNNFIPFSLCTHLLLQFQIWPLHCSYLFGFKVFHCFWLVSMVFQGSFMVFHGFWLVSMVFDSPIAEKQGGTIMAPSHSEETSFFNWYFHKQIFYREYFMELLYVDSAT